MDMKEFEASCRAAIARDRDWVEKYKSLLQKAAQSSDPNDQKIARHLRGWKRFLLKDIKIYEKILKQIKDA